MFIFAFIVVLLENLELQKDFVFKLNDWELQTPSAVTVDANENFLIVDHKGNCFYVFDRHGNPLYRIGKKGEGPDEFHFKGVIHIKTLNDNIIITDDNTRKVYIYNKNYQYIGSKSITLNLKDIHSFSDNFVGHVTSARKQEQSVILFNNNFLPTTEITKMSDLTWTKDQSNKWSRKYFSKKYLILSIKNYFLISESNEHYVSMYKKANNSFIKAWKVNLPFSDRNVTQTEINEIRIHANQTRINYTIAKKAWTIDDLMAYKDKYIIVSQEKNETGLLIHGVCLDLEGKMIGKINTSFRERVYYEDTKHGMIVIDTSKETIIPAIYTIRSNGIDIVDTNILKTP